MRERKTFLGSICLFFSILPKSVPSQALLFSIWPNDFHVHIISSLGKLCHQEAINNTRFAFFPPLTPPPILSLNVGGWTEDDDGELRTLASFSYRPDCSVGCASPSCLPQLPRNASFISSLPRTAYSQPSTKRGKTESTQKKCAVAVCSWPVGCGGKVRERPTVQITSMHTLCPWCLICYFHPNSSRIITSHLSLERGLRTWKNRILMEEIFPLFYHFLIPCVCSIEYGEEGKKRETTNQKGKLYHDSR